MSSETLSHDEAIGQFCGVTGADEERARGLLEACDWNLELAINMHVDTDPEGRSNRKPSTSTAAGPSTSASGTDNHHVVDIQDDDEDDNMNAEHGRPANDRPVAIDRRGTGFRAQYDFGRFGGRGTSSSSSGVGASSSTSYQDSDDVRPPIAPVRQILNPNPIGYPAADMAQRRYNTRTGPVSDIYDAFRDFQAEAQWQEMAQDGAESSASESSTNNSNRKRTLQELFRPPLELMFRGSLVSARECGSLQNKWLLVNIQNGREFACQILNRDVWSNQTVKDILKEHFIFWQVYHDSYEGQRYVQFYHVSSFPHVAIIDPRTGEQMKSWPTTIDHNSFCDSVIEYLTEHPSPDGSADANTMKKLRVKEEEEEVEEVVATRTTLYDQSEEAQLEAAIKASLQESEKVDINDDTIEIDEDTIEALDIPDQQQIARDKELIERSPTRENSSNSKVTATIKSPQKTPSTTSVNNNSKSETTNNKTTAEALSAAAAKRPIKIEGPECKIALRFPDGSSLVQKFSAREQLAAVRLFVQMEKSAANASIIEFVAPPNRKLTESMMNETLESLGLCPASRLEVKCIQD